MIRNPNKIAKQEAHVCSTLHTFERKYGVGIVRIGDSDRVKQRHNAGSLATVMLHPPTKRRIDRPLRLRSAWLR